MTDLSSMPAPGALAALARELGREDRQWAILAEGNCSALTADGTVRVKASGTSMRTASADDFVDVRLADLLALIDDPDAADENVRALFEAAAARSGGRRPSVEALLHAVCLDLPGVSVVGHTHPVPALSLLASARASLLTDGSLFPDQIVVLGTRPLLVPYVDPGLRLAQDVRRILRDRRDDAPRVIYLRNHGIFALGASAAEVVQVTQMAVKVATVILGALTTGGVEYMDEADVARIDTRPDEILRRAALAGTAHA